ncbi:MAG: hypothetical protein CSYNP_03749 [Syntrophus sp. SKADARSKE-3]|nr:hypothetical protein [Syntrophus sp. SKADARSKE-3]
MEEREERIPFQTGDLIEDMLSYARKLNALGEAFATMFWIQNCKNVGAEGFARFGEELGYIIQDYSQGLEIMIDNAKLSFIDRNDDRVFPLGRFQEVLDFIGKTRRPEDIVAVNHHLNELDSFIEDTMVPAIRLKTSFESLRKEIMGNKKTAPEAVVAAAGA